MVTLWRLWTSDWCGHQSPELQYFSWPKYSHIDRHWSEYLSGFNLVTISIWKTRTKPNTLTRRWDIYLKRVILTMPVSIHRTYCLVFTRATGIVPLSYYPIIPVLHGSSSWMLKGSILTYSLNSKRIPISAEHLDKPVRPQSGPRSQQFTTPPRIIYVQTPAISTTCSPVLNDQSCRSFSQMKTLHQVRMQNTIGLDFQSTSRTTANCAPLVPMPNLCATKPYGLLSNFDSREALEFHIYGFHREAPSIFIHSILVIVDHLSSSHSSPWLTIPSCHLNCTTLHSTHLFQVGVPSHITSDCSTEFISPSSVPWNCLDMKASLHFQISPKAWTNWMN